METPSPAGEVAALWVGDIMAVTQGASWRVGRIHSKFDMASNSRTTTQFHVDKKKIDRELMILKISVIVNIGWQLPRI